MEASIDRTRALVEAGIALTSELSLEAVLQRLVEIAAALTGAQYAALGVLDPSGSQLERFITTGIDEETTTTIGELPHGRGILGVLIREPQPLRLHDLNEDPRAAGFPPGHPPMNSFLGVPVRLRSVVYGNLYLTEKAGGAASSTATSTSPRRPAARTSTRTTRPRSCSSPRRRRSRSRTRACTRRRRGGASSSSRSTR